MSEIMDINITEVIENVLDRSKWVKWKFSDLVENIVEKVVPKDSGLDHYIGLKHLDTGSLKIRRFGETESLIGNKLKIYKGDLIFAKRNSYLKRVAIAEFDAVASAHALVLRPNSENVNPDLFPFFMMSEKFWQRAIEISVGSLSPTINWKVLAKQEFLLPPKDQQAQLAKLLWAMDEVIEREKEVLKKIEIHKSTYVKNCIFNFAIEMDIPFISIGELFEVKTGNKNAQDAIDNGKFPFFTRSIETQRIDTYDYDQEALILPGEGNFQIKYFKGKFNVHQRTYVLSDKGNHAIKLPLYKDVLQYRVVELIQKSVGSTVNSLRKPIIEKIKVPLLSEKDQQRVEGIVNKQDSSQSILEEKLSSSKSLQKSLINQIF